MKIVKIIIGILAILISIPLILALFMKKEYSVEQSITINKPNPQVFEYVKMLENNKYYNKWWLADPAAKMDFKGTDGTVGFIAAWDSKNDEVGKGEQEITKIADGERIDYNIRFERPFQASSTIYMATSAVSANQTKVTWVFSGANKYPMNFMNSFMTGMLGKQLYASLENLKGILEK